MAKPDTQQAIEKLAEKNAKNIRPYQDSENLPEDKPYFRVFLKNDRWDCKGYNYENHDNADRMVLYMNYFRQQVFSNILPTTDISGYYAFEIHDSYKYLENDKNYDNTFTFASNTADRWKPALLPDPFFINNWGNLLTQINDDTNWNTKLNKVVFRGTTTGYSDPQKNNRLNTCIWSLKYPDALDFKITKIAQMKLQDIQDQIPNFNEIQAPHMDIADQLKYRYILNLDGNTRRFDTWFYKCNVLNLKWRSHERLFYDEVMPDKLFDVNVDRNNILDIVRFYDSNKNQALEIIERSKQFSKIWFRPFTHQYYTVKLFENIADQSSS